MYLSQTMAWVLLWCVSGIVDIVLQAVFIFYQKEWSSETIFWIWNLKGAAFNEVFHILIPFALSVPADDNSENSPSKDFFVKKRSVLEPRRPFESTPRTLPLKIFVRQSAPKKKDKKSDQHRATFLKVAYKANILHKKVEVHSKMTPIFIFLSDAPRSYGFEKKNACQNSYEFSKIDYFFGAQKRPL